MDFRATVVLAGRTATGIQVPDEVVTALGSGKRPAVVVRVGDHTYRTTVAPMGGAYWIPLAAEHRQAAGVQAEQEVDVAIELDGAPREVAVPDDLAAAMTTGRARTSTGWPSRTAKSGCAGSRRPRSPRRVRPGSRRPRRPSVRGRRPADRA